jgi:integrase
MRQGEWLTLKWEGIDFVHGILQVRRTTTRMAHKGYTITEPKTPKSRRSIQLAQMAIDALKRHRIGQRELRLLAGSVWSDLLDVKVA